VISEDIISTVVSPENTNVRLLRAVARNVLVAVVNLLKSNIVMMMMTDDDVVKKMHL